MSLKDFKFPLPGDVGKIDEMKFVVSRAWWNQWCDYANFNSETAEERIVV